MNANFLTNVSRTAKLLKIGLKHFNLSHLLEKGTKAMHPKHINEFAELHDFRESETQKCSHVLY